MPVVLSTTPAYRKATPEPIDNSVIQKVPLGGIGPRVRRLGSHWALAVEYPPVREGPDLAGLTTTVIAAREDIAQYPMPQPGMATPYASSIIGLNRVRYSGMEGDTGWQLFNPSALSGSLVYGNSGALRFVAAQVTTTAANQVVVVSQLGAPAGQFPVTPGERLSLTGIIDAQGPVTSWSYTAWLARADGTRQQFPIAGGNGTITSLARQKTFLTVPEGFVSGYVEAAGLSSGSGALQLGLLQPMVASVASDVHPDFVQGPFNAGFGAPRVNGANQTGSQLVLANATPNATVAAGQFFNIVVSGRTYLYRTTAPTTFDGSGAGTISFWPMLRRSPANGADVRFHSPVIEGHLTDNFSWDHDPTAFIAGLRWRIEERG